MSIKITEYNHGPFGIIAIDKQVPTDLPHVIIPKEGGFATKQEAIDYIEDVFSKRKVPYLGMEFYVIQLFTPFSFMAYCSWEE